MGEKFKNKSALLRLLNSSQGNIVPKIDHFGKSLPENWTIFSIDVNRYLKVKFLEMWGVSRNNATQTGIHPSNYNPGPNPVSIHKIALKKMNPEDYGVLEKTDGVRFAFMMCKDSNGAPMAVMINRRSKKFSVEVKADDAYFDGGTLFDGELLVDEEKNFAVWWGFDAIQVAGESLLNVPYIERFAILKRCFDSISSCNVNFRLAAKTLYLASEVEKAWGCGLKKNTDGLIFSPLKDHVQTGTYWNQYKWKQNDHTVDFELRGQKEHDGKWTLGLYYVIADHTCPMADPEDRKMISAGMGNACLGLQYDGKVYRFCIERDENIEFLIRKAESKSWKRLRHIIECDLCIEKAAQIVKCTVRKIREDKESPNNRYTIRQTLLNIEENITFANIKEQLIKT